MPTMLKPEFYLKRIAKTRDPISFTLEVVKYNSFLTDRAKYMTEQFRKGLIERDVNKIKEAVTPIIFQ